MKVEGSRVGKALRRAGQRLDAVSAEFEALDAAGLSPDQWLLARARIGVLLADFTAQVAEVDRLLDVEGAQGRLLRYLQLRSGEVVSKDELSGVAGISEWARRVRELRQDHGWAIHSSVTRDDLAVGEYRLESDVRDEDLARDWATARRVRQLKTAGGLLPARVRVLEFLKAIHPRSADREQLAHVAASPQAASESVDALRQDGWVIVDATDDIDLGLAEYRLVSLERR